MDEKKNLQRENILILLTEGEDIMSFWCLGAKRFPPSHFFAASMYFLCCLPLVFHPLPAAR